MSDAGRSFGFRVAAVMLVVIFFVACGSDEQKVDQFFEQGKAYAEEESYKEAVIEFKNVLKIDPNHAQAHYQLAKAYMSLKQGRDAYWELSESVRLDPENLEARLSLGAIAMLAKDYDQALVQTEAIIERDPEHTSALILNGRVLERLGRLDEAEARLLRAIETDESRATILVLASHYIVEGRREVAEPWYQKAAEVGQDFRGYTALGKFLVQDVGRYPEAEAAFVKAASLAEEEDLEESYKNMAAFYVAAERGDEAVVTLEEGIERLQGNNELVYMLARYYRSEGEEEKAETLVRKAAAENPDDPQPALFLSAYLGSKDDMEGALEAVEQALAADPENLGARLRKSEILIDMGFKRVREQRDAGEEVVAMEDPQIAEGLQIVDGILADVPSMSEAQFVRGKALLAVGKDEEGIDALRSVVDSKPDWAEAHFVLGSSLASAGDASGARIELARAVELDPTLMEARRLLAAIHQVLGEHEYAIDQGQKYLKANPQHNPTRVLVAQSLIRLNKRDSAEAMLETIPDDERDAAIYFALGRMKLTDGKVEESRSLLRQANAQAPANAKILRALYQSDSTDAQRAESRALILKALETSPDDADLVQLSGMLAFRDNDLETAEKAFLRATELNPNNIEAHQQLARFYQLTGRTDETIETYKKAIEASPNSAKLHHFLALLYESQGQTDLAIASYEAAIKADPQHAQSKNNLAYLLAEHDRDLDRALDLAQDAKALMPNSANAADTLGWVLYKRGVPSAAVGYLNEALDGTDPDEPARGIIRHHLALAYEADGQETRALEVVEVNLVELDRRNEKARAAGKRVGAPSWEGEARSMQVRLKAG